jgi:L-lactate dehydrogenase complex protein LldF
MRVLREKSFEQRLRPWSERFSIGVWRTLANHPKLYARFVQVAARALHLMGGKKGRLHWLPGLDGWTDGRDMPAPSGKTFRELYAKRKS